MKKIHVDKLKRRLAGEVLIHVYRLMHDVVLFSLNDRCLRWYQAGLTPKELLYVQSISVELDKQNQRILKLYPRLLK